MQVGGGPLSLLNCSALLLQSVEAEQAVADKALCAVLGYGEGSKGLAALTEDWSKLLAKVRRMGRAGREAEVALLCPLVRKACRAPMAPRCSLGF